MPIDLNASLAWTAAKPDEQAMLADLQGNILDGHGRKATLNLFVRFTDPAQGLALVHDLAAHVTSAAKQLADAKAFRDTGVSGGPFVGLLLSAAGYRALGVQAKMRPDGGAFDQGMAARRATLNDPAPAALEAPYRQPIHAMILIGGNPNSKGSWKSKEVAAKAKAIRTLIGARATIVVEEPGRAIFRDNGTDESGIHKIEGIEHFGYVDGRSQPLMLRELVTREADESDGIHIWNPEFPIGQVLVPDPGAPAPAKATAFGSYFVFRKLEQDVAAFKERIERQLAQQTGLGELAGAMIVGRFEDGTPVVLQRDGGGDNPVMNNFNYDGDPDGLRCPAHAHIRKTNPRGETTKLGASIKDERSHIMARRGMTFGKRNRTVDPSDEPAGGVGLMFMAFHADLGRSFEFTQQAWANSPNFLKPGTGRDPIIGQRGAQAGVPVKVPQAWGNRGAATNAVTFAEFVRFRGGEYFFAPALSTLASL